MGGGESDKNYALSQVRFYLFAPRIRNGMDIENDEQFEVLCETNAIPNSLNVMNNT